MSYYSLDRLSEGGVSSAARRTVPSWARAGAREGRAIGMVYFLQLAGIDGDAVERGYERWFEISDFTWGLDAVTASSGRGGRSGRMRWNPLVLTAPASAALPLLVDTAARGRRIPTARFDVVQGQRVVTTRYDLRDVVITALALAGNAGAPPVLTFSLQYRKIELTTNRQDAAGGVRPGHTGSWTVS